MFKKENVFKSRDVSKKLSVIRGGDVFCHGWYAFQGRSIKKRMVDKDNRSVAVLSTNEKETIELGVGLWNKMTEDHKKKFCYLGRSLIPPQKETHHVDGSGFTSWLLDMHDFLSLFLSEQIFLKKKIDESIWKKKKNCFGCKDKKATCFFFFKKKKEEGRGGLRGGGEKDVIFVFIKKKDSEYK